MQRDLMKILSRIQGNVNPIEIFIFHLLLVENIFNGFWSVWAKNYTDQLQQYYKWKETCPNLAIGQVVIVKCLQLKNENIDVRVLKRKVGIVLSNT